jgi:hypothetical protein
MFESHGDSNRCTSCMRNLMHTTCTPSTLVNHMYASCTQFYWSLTDIDRGYHLGGLDFSHHSHHPSQPRVVRFSLMASSSLRLTSNHPPTETKSEQTIISPVAHPFQLKSADGWPETPHRCFVLDLEHCHEETQQLGLLNLRLKDGRDGLIQGR